MNMMMTMELMEMKKMMMKMRRRRIVKKIFQKT
jgi:hypothetical protein